MAARARSSTSPPPGQAAVEIRELAKSFGPVRAVDGIDLRVEAGEVRGLLGPNGAGKTTVLRMLFGLLRPDRGTVAIFGKTWAEAGAGMLDGVAGFVEDPRFYPYLSGRRNLELLAELDGDAARGRVDEALELVELTGQAGQRVAGYSSGMRQRLGLAACLLRAPRLLLLDEPTSGLDPAGARTMRVLLRRLSADGVTVLLSSHDMAEVDRVCDGVTILRSGRAVWDGTVERLRAEAPVPAHLLETSDDARALERARSEPGVSAAAAPEGGLIVTAAAGSLDAYVLALAAAGIAVRRLELVMSPVEAVFLALTAPGEEAAER